MFLRERRTGESRLHRAAHTNFLLQDFTLQNKRSGLYNDAGKILGLPENCEALLFVFLDITFFLSITV